MGCIEGRIAVEYFEELQYKNQTSNARYSYLDVHHNSMCPIYFDSVVFPATALNKPKSENFVFKCHRLGFVVYFQRISSMQ